MGMIKNMPQSAFGGGMVFRVDIHTTVYNCGYHFLDRPAPSKVFIVLTPGQPENFRFSTGLIRYLRRSQRIFCG